MNEKLGKWVQQFENVPAGTASPDVPIFMTCNLGPADKLPVERLITIKLDVTVDNMVRALRVWCCAGCALRVPPSLPPPCCGARCSMPLAVFRLRAATGGQLHVERCRCVCLWSDV